MPGIHQQLAAAAASSSLGDGYDHMQTHSALANVLLRLWVAGRLSAASLQQISEAAIADGCSHEELGVFASLGSWGSQVGNCSRDLKHYLCKSQQIKSKLGVHTQAKNTKSGLVEDVQASVLLPHVLFADLYAQYESNFHEVFGTQYVQEFWKKIDKNDVRIAFHTGLPTSPDSLQQCIPAWVHGDAVEYHDRDSLMTWSWGSMLALEACSLISSFLFTAWPKLATSKNTWDSLMHVFVWSLLAMADGKWPERHWDGSQWPPGSADANKAGMPLANGWKVVVLALLGDQEHFSNNLGMPHWNKNHFCWLCDCCKVGSVKKRFNYFGPDNEWVYRTPEEEIASPTSSHVLFSLGLTSFNIMLDILHAWDQGVWLHLAGSFLKELIYEHYKELTPTAALAVIWQTIQQYYVVLNSSVRLTNLTLSMIVHDAKHPNKQMPVLKAKAAETRHLVPVLKQIAQDLNDGSDHAMHRAATFNHAALMQRVVQHEGMFMSTHAQECLVFASSAFLAHYAALQKWAAEHDFVGYHCVPKFHMGGVHLPKQSCFINPRYVWTYKAEDWVGRVAQIAHSASFGTKSFLLSHKLVEKYELLLHLSFTRGFFDD